MFDFKKFLNDESAHSGIPTEHIDALYRYGDCHARYDLVTALLEKTDEIFCKFATEQVGHLSYEADLDDMFTEFEKAIQDYNNWDQMFSGADDDLDELLDTFIEPDYHLGNALLDDCNILGLCNFLNVDFSDYILNSADALFSSDNFYLFITNALEFFRYDINSPYYKYL